MRAFYFPQVSFFSKVKKNAVVRPAEEKIMHITIIWYLAAIKGEIPDKICPVIIPGKETRPTANSELITGIIAALNAVFRAVM